MGESARGRARTEVLARCGSAREFRGWFCIRDVNHTGPCALEPTFWTWLVRPETRHLRSSWIGLREHRPTPKLPGQKPFADERITAKWKHRKH